MVNARRIYRRTVTSCGYLGSQQRVTFRLMDRRMLLYPLVFFCCWGPGRGSRWCARQAGGACVCLCVCSSLCLSVSHPAVVLASIQVVNPSLAQGATGVTLYILQVGLNLDAEYISIHCANLNVFDFCIRRCTSHHASVIPMMEWYLSQTERAEMSNQEKLFPADFLFIVKNKCESTTSDQSRLRWHLDNFT